MRVLVTGGAGFIGSNLVYALVSGRHEVGVIDDLSVGKPGNVHPSAWFRRLDILDPGLPAAVAEFAPDAVVHLAAQAGDIRLERRTLDGQAEVGDTGLQELEPHGLPALDEGSDGLGAHGKVRK